MNHTPGFVRHDVTVPVPGADLAAWWYQPTTQGPWPAVVMAHGFGAVKDMFLDRFAERFARAGLAVLVFDHRGFGHSTGEPRQEADPEQQARDYRHAITSHHKLLCRKHGSDTYVYLIAGHRQDYPTLLENRLLRR